MNVFNTVNKGFKAVGSFGGAIADTIEGNDAERSSFLSKDVH